MRFRVGTMGFSYDDWRGVFYPPELKPSDRLAFYAKHYDSIELDTTFHAVPPPERFERWAEQVPDHFRFAVKTPRAITHEMNLADAPPAMLDFVRVASRLGKKLGVVLIQFPPALPSRVWPQVRRLLDRLPTGPGYAIEFRNDTWFDPRVFDAIARDLRKRNIALVGAEYDVEPREPVATADFSYLRLIGLHGRYQVLDHERWDATEHLRWWLDRVTALHDLRVTWALFSDDYAGFSPGTADRFKALVGQAVEPMHVRQGRLF
ncbi:MAG: DUF72 domain-containing protein [Tepidisphaeraceae bacterium]